jgi:hypothetical protein
MKQETRPYDSDFPLGCCDQSYTESDVIQQPNGTENLRPPLHKAEQLSLCVSFENKWCVDPLEWEGQGQP